LINIIKFGRQVAAPTSYFLNYRQNPVGAGIDRPHSIICSTTSTKQDFNNNYALTKKPNIKEITK